MVLSTSNLNLSSGNSAIDWARLAAEAARRRAATAKRGSDFMEFECEGTDGRSHANFFLRLLTSVFSPPFPTLIRSLPLAHPSGFVYVARLPPAPFYFRLPTFYL